MPHVISLQSPQNVPTWLFKANFQQQEILDTLQPSLLHTLKSPK